MRPIRTRSAILWDGRRAPDVMARMRGRLTDLLHDRKDDFPPGTVWRMVYAGAEYGAECGGAGRVRDSCSLRIWGESDAWRT